jgi:hypothetical protein
MDIELIKEQLLLNKGDLFDTARNLNCTPRQLDVCIRSSKDLQDLAVTIDQVKVNTDYETLSDEQFNNHLKRLSRSYQLEAIEVIHELATMSMVTDIGTNSAPLADVRLKAAVRLREAVEDNSQRNDIGVFAELNELYRSSSQRIKTVRLAQIEFDDD